LQGWGQENFCRSGAAVKFWGWGEIYGNAVVTEKNLWGWDVVGNVYSTMSLYFHVTFTDAKF